MPAPWIGIGSPAEDRLRLAQLVGKAPTAGWLLRTPGQITGQLTSRDSHQVSTPACTLSWAIIPPQFDVTWNSQIPVETNSGGAWAGRGASVGASAGVRASCWRLTVQLAPEMWYAANRDFAIITANASNHSDFANPFHSGDDWSADLPIRMGTQPLLAIQPGQTSVELSAGPVAAGIGTESQWWGPGIRNAIIMSNHAAGVPAIYARTAHPIDVRIGQAEARWISGVLSESPFFTTAKRGRLRSLSGLVVTLRTAMDTGLTIGMARVVFAELANVNRLPSHVLDPVAVWGHGLNVRSDTSDRTDQLSSLFARWVFPESGFEMYGEWARVILPKSLRSLLVEPQFSQGFTVGMQWTNAFDDRGGWRVQAEATNLEQVYQSRGITPPTFYVSPSVSQGYTQRGRVIGAMIGPGSSSQFFGLDRLLAAGSVGLVLERTRWDNDAYYRAPTGTGVWAHDVSLTAGLRATQRTSRAEITGEIDLEQRLNFLFQSATSGYTEDRTFDVHNISFRMSVRPARVRAP